MDRHKKICSSQHSLRFMIEKQGIYDDGRLEGVACSRLNRLNYQEQFEDIEEKEAEYNQCFEEKQARVTEMGEAINSAVCIDQFLAFCNPFPDINSDTSEKIKRNQAEEFMPIETQFEGSSIEDSGGTTIFHPIFAEEYIEPKRPKRQHPHQPQREDRNYSKNLACYISRSIRRMIFDKFLPATQKLCKRKGISLQQFQAFCDSSKFSGISSISSFYEQSGNATESEMKKIFRHLYQKILRRSYLRTVIEEGKMTKINAYIEYKNRYLLNLDQIELQ